MLRPATVAIPRLGNLAGEVPKSIADARLLILSLEREIRSIEIDLINSGSRLEFDFQGDDLRWSNWEAERRKQALNALQQKTALEGWLVLQECKGSNQQQQSIPNDSKILAIRKSTTRSKQESKQEEEMIQELKVELAALRAEVAALKRQVESQVESQGKVKKQVDNLSNILETLIRQFTDYFHKETVRNSTRWVLSTFPGYIRSLRKHRGEDADNTSFNEQSNLFNFLIAQGHNPPFATEVLQNGAKLIKQASVQSSVNQSINPR
jgi:small-conductance mechanosensitive channel